MVKVWLIAIALAFWVEKRLRKWQVCDSIFGQDIFRTVWVYIKTKKRSTESLDNFKFSYLFTVSFFTIINISILKVVFACWQLDEPEHWHITIEFQEKMATIPNTSCSKKFYGQHFSAGWGTMFHRANTTGVHI